MASQTDNTIDIFEVCSQEDKEVYSKWRICSVCHVFEPFERLTENSCCNTSGNKCNFVDRQPSPKGKKGKTKTEGQGQENASASA